MNTACPLCHSDRTFVLQSTEPLADSDPLLDAKIIAAGEVLSFVACQACGLVFRSPRPSAEQLANYYENLLPQRELGTMRSFGVSRELADARNDRRYSRLFDELRSLVNGAPGHIIDIGGWDGRSLVPWQAAGWSATLIDPGATKRALANQEIRAIGSVAEANRSGLQPATLITSYHCIEHLLDIDRWITESRPLSDAGTVWVIEVPFDVIYVRKLLRKQPLERANVHPLHLNFFTPRSLTALAERMGLEPASVKIVITPYWHGPTVSLRMVARASSQRRAPSPVKYRSPLRIRASLALGLPTWRRVAGLMFRYARARHPEWG